MVLGYQMTVELLLLEIGLTMKQVKMRVRSLSINLWMESGVNLAIAFWGNTQGINLQGVH